MDLFLLRKLQKSGSRDGPKNNYNVAKEASFESQAVVLSGLGFNKANGTESLTWQLIDKVFICVK